MPSLVEPAVYVLASGTFLGTAGIVWFLWHHSSWRGAVDTDRTNFKEFMREIRGKIDQIQEQIEQILRLVEPPPPTPPPTAD